MKGSEAIYHVKAGRTYRMTTTVDGITRSGLVTVEIDPPRVQVLGGRTTFVLVDPATNELMAGPIDDDFEIEEINPPAAEIVMTPIAPAAELREGGGERV